VTPLALLVAALAGGLTVYLYFATRPAAYDEPADVVVNGITMQQVAGAGGARHRVLIALGALLACLVFLAGALSTL
jgi:hypothetical protein